MRSLPWWQFQWKPLGMILMHQLINKLWERQTQKLQMILHTYYSSNRSELIPHLRQTGLCQTWQLFLLTAEESVHLFQVSSRWPCIYSKFADEYQPLPHLQLCDITFDKIISIVKASLKETISYYLFIHDAAILDILKVQTQESRTWGHNYSSTNLEHASLCFLTWHNKSAAAGTNNLKH
jgi:hypothetical protein